MHKETALPSALNLEDPEYHPIVGSLYHYTSFEAAMSIVESKTLRATAIEYMNDSSEMEHGLQVMRAKADELTSTCQDSERDFFKRFMAWIDNREPLVGSVHVLCFSESGNQLSQWRGYAPHGRGVALGIDASILVHRMQALGWTFHTCRYRRKSQNAFANAILARMCREVISVRKTISDPEVAFMNVLRANFSELMQVSAMMKHDAFHEEREVRFISPFYNRADPKVKYRAGRTAIVPFVEFTLTDRKDQSLAQAVFLVGPGPNDKLTRASLLGLLEQQKFASSYSVELSGIPYREL